MAINPSPTLEEVRAKREDLLVVFASKRARNPRVFGSVARGEATSGSDVDFVVDLDEPVPQGWHYFGMLEELEQALGAVLGRSVHVVEITRQSRAAEHILQTAVPL